MSNNHDRLRPALLACGVIGPALFIVVFLIEDATPAIRPTGYSPLRHPVSSFAIGEFGWIQAANFILAGALLLGFAVGLRPVPRREGGGISISVLFGMIAVGLIGAGVFTTDPISGYPPGMPLVPEGAARTTHGALHDAFSALFFLGLPAACVVVGHRFAKAGHRYWAGYSIGTAVVFLVGFVLTSMGFAQQPALASIGGLLQRLTVFAGLWWIAALALHLIRSTQPAPTPSP